MQEINKSNVVRFRNIWQEYAKLQEAFPAVLVVDRLGKGRDTVLTPIETKITQQALDSTLRKIYKQGGKWERAIMVDCLCGCNLNLDDLIDPRAVLGQIIMKYPDGGEWRGVVWDPTCIAPPNFIRMALYYGNQFEHPANQRVVEALSGWLAATKTIDKKVDVDDLQCEVALTIGKASKSYEPPARLIVPADSSEEIMECMDWFVKVVAPRCRDWCEVFARETVRRFVNDFRTFAHESTGIDDEIRNNTPCTDDPIQEFQDLQDARDKIDKYLPMLTATEQQVAALKATGMTQREIAAHMGIGFESVNTLLDRTRKRVSGDLPPSRSYQQDHKSSQNQRSKKKNK